MKIIWFCSILLMSMSLCAYLSEKDITNLYKGISGFSIDAHEYNSISKQGGDPLYGELTFSGVKALLAELKPTEKDIFYDLGCGVGKACVQIIVNSPIKKCVGVELSPTRAHYAQQIAQKLKKMGVLPNNKQLIFINNNIRDVDMCDGTLFYMGCYGKEVMEATLGNISKIPHELRFMSIQRTIGHPEFMLIKTVPIKMTWGESVNVYIYKKAD